MKEYYGPTKWYYKCPIAGNCIWKGIRCKPNLRCTWLEYELKVHKEVKEKK